MKKINFVPIDDMTEEFIDAPLPAKNFLPDWYKDLSSHIIPNNVPRYPPNDIGSETNLTAKRCMPIFDSMTSGYMFTLPCDVYFVDPEEYGHRVIWAVTYSPVGNHGKRQVGSMSFPEGYDEGILKWHFPFIIETPPGYSCMFTHPNHRYDLPFITISGIVDTDTHPIPINFPFFVKNNFIGKLEKGTPLCQIIPFKRDEWVSKKDKNRKRNNYILDHFFSSIEKGYKNRFWHKKSFK